LTYAKTNPSVSRRSFDYSEEGYEGVFDEYGSKRHQKLQEQLIDELDK